MRIVLIFVLILAPSGWGAKACITATGTWAGVATDGTNITVEAIGGGLIIVTYTPGNGAATKFLISQ